MTGQLELDFALDDSLPVEAGTVEQVAVVFTALGGPRVGELVYHTSTQGIEHLQWYASVWLPKCASDIRKTSDARVMRRTVTCGPWEPA